MTLSIKGERVNDYAVELVAERTAYSVEEPLFDSEAAYLPMISAEDNMTFASISNEAMNPDTIGKMGDGVGTPSENSTVTLNSYVYGTMDGGSGDGVTPTPNGFTHALCALLGQAHTSRAGALLTGSPTPTEVSEAAAGNYQAGDLIPIVKDNGEVEVGVIASSALGVHTLALALDGAPSSGALVLGSHQIQVTNRFTQLVQGRIVHIDQGPGNDQTSPFNSKFYGGVPTQLQFGAANRNAAQTCTITLKIARFLRNIFASKAGDDTFVPFANNLSRVVLAKRGQTAGMRGDFFSVEININNDIIASPGRGETGTLGWVRGSDAVSTINTNWHARELAPSGFTEQYLQDIYTNRVNNFWHGIVQFGTDPGDVVAIYFPSLKIDAYPLPTEVERIAALPLLMAVTSNSAARPLIRMLQC